jgi:hypothetical protein
MTTDQAAAAAQAPAQSVNGQAPPDAEDQAPADTGERWLGILVIAAGCFLLIVGIDRVTGGRVTGAFSGSE